MTDRAFAFRSGPSISEAGSKETDSSSQSSQQSEGTSLETVQEIISGHQNSATSTKRNYATVARLDNTPYATMTSIPLTARPVQPVLGPSSLYGSRGNGTTYQPASYGWENEWPHTRGPSAEADYGTSLQQNVWCAMERLDRRTSSSSAKAPSPTAPAEKRYTNKMVNKKREQARRGN
jgi:hypothetical protein